MCCMLWLGFKLVFRSRSELVLGWGSGLCNKFANCACKISKLYSVSCKLCRLTNRMQHCHNEILSAVTNIVRICLSVKNWVKVLLTLLSRFYCTLLLLFYVYVHVLCCFGVLNKWMNHWSSFLWVLFLFPLWKEYRNNLYIYALMCDRPLVCTCAAVLLVQ